MADGKLSALKVAKATRPGKYGDGFGLYLQIAKAGSKSWVFRYCCNSTSTSGKRLQREMGLGPFPLYSLKEARERRDVQRKLVRDGVDPLKHKNAKKTAAAVEAAKAVSFQECAERYIESHKHGWKNLKHAAQWTSTLQSWVFPHIGQLPVASVDVSLVMQVLQQRIGEGRDAPTFWNCKTETASRVRGRIECVLSWAKAQGLRAGENPAAWGDLRHLLPARASVAAVEHHKAMPFAELPAFMSELRKNDSLVSRALEWTVLTACRTGDTLGATWREIDRKGKVWVIPAARVKGKKGKRRSDHVVPLCERAIAILDSLPAGTLLFPLSNSMLDLLSGMRPGEELTVHGFRSSFKDWVSEQTGYQNEMSELALAHTMSSKVEEAYRRGAMLDKRRRMMDDWSQYCASPPASKANVIPLRG